MNPEAQQMRAELEITKKAYESAQAKLKDYVTRCQHKFGEVKYDPIHQQAYTIPGDKPGTMGVDWRGPQFVPAQTTPRWKKECGLCGLVKETTATEDKVTKTPRW
jgi:hypothetical protein